MANLTKAILLAAVALYSPLHVAGKTEEEVKAAIAADEKKFNEEQVNKIYEAILNPPPSEQEEPEFAYKVIKEFRDKDNFEKVHKPGDKLTSLDEDRAERLIELKLIEKI